MSEFPLLSDERIDIDWFYLCDLNLSNVAKARLLARAIESESRAPLLAEIERLKADAQNLRRFGQAAVQFMLGAHQGMTGEFMAAIDLWNERNPDEAIDAARAQGGE